MIPESALEHEPPLPLLVTGLTGVSGYNAFAYFRDRYPGQVIALRQASKWPLTGEGIVACDAEDPDGLRRLFDQHQFKAVLNCAGNCALKSCELDPSMAWRLNLSGIENLLHVIESADVRLVHVSIDLVFSGVGNGDYVERDWTDPVTVYGKSMAAAEHLVMLARPDACVLRISLPMGPSHSNHAGAIDWIQWRFANRKPATLYFDEVRTPTYTDCLNRVFHYVLAHPIQGLFHAGGPRRLSLYNIAQIVNRVGGYDPDLLIGCPRIDAGPMPPRAGNVTMRSEKLSSAIGMSPFDPWPLDEAWVPTHHDWHYERHAATPGSPELLADILYRNPLMTERSSGSR